MGPARFKDFDKRRYHVKDMTDVIEWFEYRRTRDEEALKVIKSMRNSHSLQKSVIKSYENQRAAIAERPTEAEESLSPGEPGTLQSESNEPTAVQDERILDELREVLDEKERALNQVDEVTDEDLSNYAIFFVKGTPRYRKDHKMVKTADVPEAIREVLLKSAESKDEAK